MTRKVLVGIASSSEFSNSQEVINFIAKLQSRGIYTEATEDEIEEYDLIDEVLYEA